MNIDHAPAQSPSRRIALLIDADNISHNQIATILAELAKYGTANIRRAYGDWGSPSLKGWKEKLHDFAIRPIQQFSYSVGKNATDIALVIDAMELLYTQKLDAFCIASSDADFTPLIMQLKANGHEVYGFGDRKTPPPFVAACTTFLFLDPLEPTLDSEPRTRSAGGESPPQEKTGPAEKAPAKGLAKGPALAPPARNGKLSQDTKLVTILRGAVAASAKEDGWAAMSAAGAAAKRQAPIDPRNYNVKNFTALFEATGLFTIHKAENGQSFVADKRNRDRTEQPAC